MKVLICSDIHLHNFSNRFNSVDRLKVGTDFIRHIFEEANRLGIKQIIHCGDLFHKQVSPPTIVVNAAVEVFREMFALYDISFVSCSGNHDLAVRNNGGDLISSQEVLSTAFPNFYLDRDISFENPDGLDLMISVIPYIHSQEYLDKCLNELGDYKNCRSILLVHQEPFGLYPGSGELDVENENFLKFDHVFSGHIHHYKRYTANFTMVGAPMQQNRGEEGVETGYLIYDVNSNSHRFIHYKKSPRFITGQKVDDYNFYTSPVNKEEEEQRNFGDFDIDNTPTDLLKEFCRVKGFTDTQINLINKLT